MSKSSITPTNPDEEEAKGRIALWLEPDDLKFIAAQYQELPADASNDVVERWARISFRAHTALHKAGIK